MFQLKPNINLSEEPNLSQKTINKHLVEALNHRLFEVSNGGGEKSVKRHVERGRMLVRQRIDYLLDPNTPFLELSPLAANDQYKNQFPAAGIITGIGKVHNRWVMIVANDATVKGGTYIKETIKKHLRAQEIALKNELPCIYMVDSGGIFLPEQSNVFPDKTDFGRIFFNQARMSAQGIAQIAMVMGSCTAGGAYIPAMSDETIIVRNQGTIFLAGPPLVKAATGEVVTEEELGGGDTHTRISGVADHLADDDAHAIHICRNIVSTLNPAEVANRSDIKKPLYPIEDLYSLIPPQGKTFPDVREVIARLTDGSEFHEFKENYGNTLVCGFANINGQTIGIIANNGILFSESAQKGAHFIQLCNSRQTPMLFLQNITGFMVGKTYEHQGIAKDGAKMVNSLANSSVPKITIIMGGSYGAGNYAMAGRAFEPDFLFMWPNAQIGVMGAKQAAEVLVSLKSKQPHQPTEAKLIESSIMESYQHESSAMYSTSRLWDDGIIDPAQTRHILSIAFDICQHQPKTSNNYGIFRM